jgi:hypothetical protein
MKEALRQEKDYTHTHVDIAEAWFTAKVRQVHQAVRVRTTLLTLGVEYVIKQTLMVKLINVKNVELL